MTQDGLWHIVVHMLPTLRLNDSLLEVRGVTVQIQDDQQASFVFRKS